MKYQGWTNEQTWCVVLTLDNEKHEQDWVLKIVGDIKTQLSGRAFTTPQLAKENFRMLVAEKISAYAGLRSWKIFEMAPWCWKFGTSLDTVNWNEVADHYIDKDNEIRN